MDFAEWALAVTPESTVYIQTQRPSADNREEDDTDDVGGQITRLPVFPQKLLV